MRNILILGGTRFFGIHLVKKLLQNGDQVTVASRNFSKADLPPEVKTITVDRESEQSLKKCRQNGPYDLVYDQICYSPDEATVFLKSLEDVTAKLIHTSTQSTYISNGLERESDFDPYTYPVRLGSKTEFTYAEGKRLAEAIYFQKAKIPVTAVRLPLVLGTDDYTGRLNFHIERVRQGRPIVAENPAARTSLIQSEQAAHFLFWVGLQNHVGPINACSNGQISLLNLINLIESVLNKKALLKPEGEKADISPYSPSEDRCLDNSKAKELGFQFSSIESWLPVLVKQMANS